MEEAKKRAAEKRRAKVKSGNKHNEAMFATVKAVKLKTD